MFYFYKKTKSLILATATITATYLSAEDLTVTGVLSAEDAVLATGQEGYGAIPEPGIGTSLLWSPGKSALRAGYVGTDAWTDSNIPLRSTAFGSDVNANSFAEFAIGQFNTDLIGDDSNWVTSDALFVIGNGTDTNNRSNALTIYKNGFAEFTGDVDVAGDFTVSGQSVLLNTANLDYDAQVSIGLNSQTSGIGSFATGESSKALKKHSAAFGFGTKADGDQAFVAGRSSEATGQASVALGYKTRAKGLGAFSTGESTNANKKHSATFGFGTTADADQALAAGRSTVASGKASAAFGISTRASGKGSFALGEYSRAMNEHSIAMGFATRAEAKQSVAFGRQSIALGRTSVAMGYQTIARAENTFALGRGTEAANFSSVAMGQYNVLMGGDTLVWDPADYLVAFGNGSGDANRSNAFLIMKSGNTLIGFDETNPQYKPTEKLEVIGNSKITGDLEVSGNLNVKPQGDIPMITY